MPKRILTDDDLKFLAGKIAETEAATSGEIRVAVRHKRHWRERSLTLHQIALREFRRLGMQDKEGRTGVLILVLVPERAFQIIGDEGIHSKVREGTWEAIAEGMTAHFKMGKFRDGLAEAIARVGAELSAHYPRTPGDANQLPNDVIEE